MLNLGARGEMAVGGIALLIAVVVLALTNHCDAGVAAHFGVH